MKHLTTMILAISILALAAFALPALLRSLPSAAKNQASTFTARLKAQFAAQWLQFGPRLVGVANDTYDAAVETHCDTITRTNDVAVTARHLLWTQGAASGGVALATAGLPALGTIDNTESSTGVRQSVKLLGKGETKKVVASEAILEGGKVFQAAGGKVAATGAIFIGTALSAAAADNDIIELDDCAPIINGARVLTAATTLTAADSGSTFYLASAGGFTVTLPANATAGFKATFIVKTAPTTAYILLAATADTIIGYPQSSVGADESANGNAAGDQINFVANTSLPSDRVDVEFDGTSIHARCTCKASGAITITG